MTLGRHLGHNKFHIRNKAHIKHPVSFIQDYGIKLCQINKSPVYQIFQATGCTDDKTVISS